MMSITIPIQSLCNNILCSSPTSNHSQISPIWRPISTKPQIRKPISQTRKSFRIVSSSEWLKKLPEKNVPLYSHSLPCLEAWLNSLGFNQSKADRALWLIHNPHWHARLSLDVNHLSIRYVKSGPGNVEKDLERRFGYQLSREDIENALLGGP